MRRTVSVAVLGVGLMLIVLVLDVVWRTLASL